MTGCQWCTASVIHSADAPTVIATVRHLPARERLRRAVGARQGELVESVPVQPVDEERPEREERDVGHAHQEQPLAPVDAADQRCGNDRRDAAGQQHGRGEPVDGIQRHHDRLRERRAARHLREVQRLLVDVHEYARARRGRRQDEREQRKREQQLQVERASAAARAAQKKERHPLREAAARDRQADGEHADQEIGDRISEAGQAPREIPARRPTGPARRSARGW